MNRVVRLRKLRKAYCYRLNRLRHRLSQCSGLCESEQDMLIAYSTIEAINGWAAFVRSYYLSCMMNAETERGRTVLVSQSGLSADAAIGVAVQRFKPNVSPLASGQWHRRTEPPWHDPNTLLTLSAHVSCSQHSEISAAFSLGATVFAGLPVFRNFFAHRNEGTLSAVRSIAPRYMVPSTLRPAAMLVFRPLTRPSGLLDEWLDELEVTARLLVR